MKLPQPLQRFSLTVRPESRKKVVFQIWDNDSGVEVDKAVYTFPHEDKIAPTRMIWERKIKELNKKI